MMPHTKMAPKAVRKPTAEKKVGAASRTTSTTRTKASLGDKKKEEVSKSQETENVVPEKVEEVVESLISSVISNVEAEFVESTKNLEIAPANRRRSSEPQQRSEDDSAAEERRRRIGRGDSEAQLEEILQHIFTAPTNVTILTRKESATITPAKNTAPVLSSKSPRPMKVENNQASHQKATKTASKPANPMKSSMKAAPKKADPTNVDMTEKSAPSSEVLDRAPEVQEQETKQPQPPIRKKLPQQPSKTGSKKAQSTPDNQKSEPSSTPLKEGKSEVGRGGIPPTKAMPRQVSSNKMQLDTSNKGQDAINQKNLETAVTMAPPSNAGETPNKVDKAKFAAKPNVKSTALETKTNTRNPVAVKRAVPPSKTSKA